MADDDPSGGLGALRDRVERRSRQVPPPRAPSADLSTTPTHNPGAAPVEDIATPALVGEGIGARLDQAPSTPAPAPRPRRSAPPPAAGRAHPKTAPDEPSANLAIRVRRSLDEHLNELIFELRRNGIRTSKVELIEMLLWELPSRPGEELTARLSAFRHAAPRRDQL